MHGDICFMVRLEETGTPSWLNSTALVGIVSGPV